MNNTTIFSLSSYSKQHLKQMTPWISPNSPVEEDQGLKCEKLKHTFVNGAYGLNEKKNRHTTVINNPLWILKKNVENSALTKIHYGNDLNWGWDYSPKPKPHSFFIKCYSLCCDFKTTDASYLKSC